MDELIVRFRQSHEELVAVIARFSEQRLIQPLAPGDWSARDLIAHIAAWDSWVQRAFELYQTSDHLSADMQADLENVYLYNARAAEAWKSYDAAQVRAAFDKPYADLLDFLTSASHEQLYRQIMRPDGNTTTPMETLGRVVDHNHRHRAHLEEALGK